MLGSMKLRKSELQQPQMQFDQLNFGTEVLRSQPKFDTRLQEAAIFPLTATEVEIVQVNLGKMCNQTCKHCHVDAGPDRREIMTRETMGQLLDLLRGSAVQVVDLTGGAPEMNPNFRWFVSEIAAMGKTSMVRCNLTIILANKSYNDLPQFFKDNRVHVVSSLPYYDRDRTDRQRGKGVFDDSIQALKMLNDVGYGIEGTGLKLDLVYNPNGAFLPGPQASLEADFKREMKKLFDIEFNQLFAITNMPISRFLEYLIESDNLESYMVKLVNAFNPQAALGAMCRNMISVGWDGYVFDCDFNQMLDMKIDMGRALHVSQLSLSELKGRKILTNQHCYGCTAGTGSSCGGSTATT